MHETKGPLKPVPHLYIKAVYIDILVLTGERYPKKQLYRVLWQVISDYDWQMTNKVWESETQFPKIVAKRKKHFLSFIKTKNSQSFNSNL